VPFGEHDQRLCVLIRIYTYDEIIVRSVSASKCTIRQNLLMKPIIGALKAKWPRPKAPVADNQTSDPVCVKPEDLAKNDDNVETAFDAEMHGRIDSLGPGKNVLMPDIYGNEYVATVPDLKILDLSSPDTDESTGFNPYDTAVLRKK